MISSVTEITSPRRRLHTPSWLIRWGRSPVLRVDLPLVLVVIVILEVIVFHGYLTGQTMPSGDFLGSYNGEPYAWWRDGGFFGTHIWNSQELGGYPTSASIQNGSFYLPIGLFAIFGTYNLHSAAFLSAAHVAFGAIGVYVLARRFRLNRCAAILGLTAYFFSPTFYADAEHVDIPRAAAWLPWILLILSPKWPWRRWFAIPLAAFMLWQAVVGSYPGVIIAIVYLGTVWLIAWQIVYRPKLREFLIPMAISVILGALLCLPKYLPMIYSRGVQSGVGLDQSTFDRYSLDTLFFTGWRAAAEPIFLPITIIVALGLTRLKKETVVGLIVAAVGIIMAFPRFPWFQQLSALPGMSLSRWRVGDFKTIILLMAIFVAMIGLDHLIRSGRRRIDAERVVFMSLALLAVGAIAVLAKWQSLPSSVWVAPLTLGVLSYIIILFLVLSRQPAANTYRLSTLALVVLTIISGCVWAFGSADRWIVNREQTEVLYYGESVNQLIADYQPPSTIQRPPRTPPVVIDDLEPVGGRWASPGWARSYYSGQDAVGGNANLKGTQTFDLQHQSLGQPTTHDQADAFLSAPGIAISSDTFDATGQPSVDAINNCVKTEQCGQGLTVTPVSYVPGNLSYDIDSTKQQTITFNESYFPGWVATLTPTDGGKATTATPSIGVDGMTQIDMPEGSYHVRLQYEQKGIAAGWVGFGLGIFGQMVAALIVALTAHRRRRSSRAAAANTITSGAAGPSDCDSTTHGRHACVDESGAGARWKEDPSPGRLWSDSDTD